MAGGWDGGAARGVSGLAGFDDGDDRSGTRPVWLSIGDVVPGAPVVARVRGEPWWAAAICRARAEAAAAEKLAERGVPAFSPVIWGRAFVDGKRTWIKKAMFPGYVIVDVGAFGLAQAESTGVRVVRSSGPGSAAARLPWAVVNDLLLTAALPEPVDDERGLRVGDRVRVVDHPLAGFVGKVVGLDSGGRVRLLLDLLGRGQRAQVPARLLERVLPHDDVA